MARTPRPALLRDLKTLTTPENATMIHAWIVGTRDPEEDSEAARAYVARCYHRPDDDEIIMEAADALLGTCGVEGWASDDGRTGVSYCNTGDTYDRTLCLTPSGFKVAGMDYLVERYENLD